MLLSGKTAAITGAASGIGRATAEALLAAGARVVAVDRDEAALAAMAAPNLLPLPLDLLDPDACATLVPRALGLLGAPLDVFHANAGLYLGGDLLDADPAAIDRTVALNVAVVMKTVRDALAHMVPRGTGDVVVTSSLAAHYPTPWEPVYAASKWAVDCFVQTTRRQLRTSGVRVGSVSPGPVATGLLADWPPEKLAEARASRTLIEPAEIADIVLFALTRPRHVTIRDVVVLPTGFDL